MPNYKISPEELDDRHFQGMPYLSPQEKADIILRRRERVAQGLPPDPTPEESARAWWNLGMQLGVLVLVVLLWRQLFAYIERRRRK